MTAIISIDEQGSIVNAWFLQNPPSIFVHISQLPVFFSKVVRQTHHPSQMLPIGISAVPIGIFKKIVGQLYNCPTIQVIGCH